MGTDQSVLDYKGVLISEVVSYTKATFGIPESVLNIECPYFLCPDLRRSTIARFI